MMVEQFHSLVQYSEDRDVIGRVGIFIDTWRPPHDGHFQSMLKYIRSNDILYIIISERDYNDSIISADQAEEIWNIYADYINDDRLVITRIGSHGGDTGNMSEARAIYDFINIANGGGRFTPSRRFTVPHPSAKSMYSMLDGEYNKYNLNVYCSQDSINNIFNKLPSGGSTGGSRYINGRVDSIRLHADNQSMDKISREISTYRQNNIQSSNDMRERILSGSLKHNDYASIRKNLPGDGDVKDMVIDILLKS